MQNCDAGYRCSANNWVSPSQATGDAFCEVVENAKIINSTVPGDVCIEDSECFGLNGEVECNSDVNS